MSLPRKRWTLVGALLAAMLLTSVAAAAITQKYSQTYTVKRTGQSTGMIFKASQPGASPVAVKKVTMNFPSGSKINPGAVAKCTTPPACPAKSKVGSGAMTVLVAGIPVPISVNTVGLYNRSGGLVIVADPGLPGVPPIVLKPVLSGLKLTLDIPKLALPAPGGGVLSAVLSSMSLSTRQIGKGSKAYTRTPSTCPKGGWTFKTKFDYYDGTSQTKKFQSMCRKG